MSDLEQKKIAGRYLFGQKKKSVGAPALTQLLNYLSKKDLADFLQKIQPNNNKNLKSELIQTIINQAKKTEIRQFLNQHRQLLALHPTDLQIILGCSKSERIRWTNEGKLTVVGQGEFKYGSYPTFDWLDTVQLSYSKKLSRWREQLYQSDHRD